jgi:hypothetical protein
MGNACGGLACVLGLVTALPAAAQSIEEGRAAYLAPDFDRARATFEQALASPGLTRADAVEAHRYLAALASFLGDDAAARAHAQAAAALDPAAVAPEGAPPAVVALFDAARRELGGVAAALRIEAAGSHVRARLAPAPELLAAALRLRCDPGPAEATGPPPELTVDLGPEPPASATCRAAAATAAGAALLTAEQTLAFRTEVIEDEPERRSAAIWAVPLAAGVVVAAVVVTLVVVLAGGSGGGVPVTLHVPGWN